MYSSGMVTRIREGTRGHLYIREWVEYRGLEIEQLAGRLNIERESAYRWMREQHRLNPEKIAALAEALDIEPEQLWRRPSHESLDAMVANAPDDLRQTVTDVVRRLVGKR